MTKIIDRDGLLYFWQKIVNSFVKKENGKGLSTNDYTTEEKNKLAGIAEQANKTVVDTALSSTSTNPVQNNVIKAALDAKVSAVEGKGLSTNDLTDELLAKINNAGDSSFSGNYEDLNNKPDLTVYENKIETVKVNGTAQTITAKEVNITVPTNNNQIENGAGYQTASDVSSAISSAVNGLATETYVNNKVAAVYKYKGSVASESALPTSDQVIGDTYNLEDTGMNVAWNGTNWDNLGTVIDLTEYVQKNDLEVITNAEIDAIVAS